MYARSRPMDYKNGQTDLENDIHWSSWETSKGTAPVDLPTRVCYESDRYLLCFAKAVETPPYICNTLT